MSSFDFEAMDRAVNRLRLVELAINRIATEEKERGHDELAADLCTVGASIHGALKDITITRELTLMRQRAND